jgi:hypothetical protein
VLVRVEGNIIDLRFVIDGEISEHDRESASCVASEVIADFSAPHTIREECLRVDAPLPIPSDATWKMVYKRKEPRGKDQLRSNKRSKSDN